MSQPNPVFTCDKCVYLTNDKMSMEKHCWSKHPTDNFQKYWSEKRKSDDFWKLNMGYQDDPYY